MNQADGFGRTVSEWLHADAEGRVPEHLEAVLRRTSTEGQRPAWSSLERWLPVQATLRIAPAPRFAWSLVIVAVALAIAAAAIAAGAWPRRPDPFGPARNGAVVYGGMNGDIYAVDAATGTSRPIIVGNAADRAPWVSLDGSRIAFAREVTPHGPLQVMVADVDGAAIRAVSGPVAELTWFAWSPDGSRLAVVDALAQHPTLTIYPVDGAAPHVLDIDGMTADAVQWRPDGQGLLFRGVTADPVAPTSGLYTVGVDGSELRSIALPLTGDAWYQAPALSPDGMRVVFTQWGDNGGLLWVVSVDGGPIGRLAFDGPPASEYGAQWSPDGSQLVFNRWVGDVFHVAVGPAGGGHAVELGPAMHAVGAAEVAFSPDGSKVIARYSTDGQDGSTWIFPMDGGPAERLPASETLASWQRLAP